LSGVERIEGRTVFGADPAAYDRARPGYPEGVFDVLRERCGLGVGTAVFEIGPGPGTATRRLLELGARPLYAVEPNPAFAAYLDTSTHGAVSLLVEPFEEAELPASAFDLGAAASSFHWVDPAIGLAKVRRLLRPRGWWAMWANLNGDQTDADLFHRATQHILGPRAAGPFGTLLDSDARLLELANVGFEEATYELVRWTCTFDTAAIRALYATFSPIARREPAERERVLDAVAEVAADEFGGLVERTMLTPIYTAWRPLG
jgi:SAM-dependent methyltransferase